MELPWLVESDSFRLLVMGLWRSFHPRPWCFCAEDWRLPCLSLLLMETPLSQQALVIQAQAAHTVQHRRGAVSSWWKQVIECVPYVSASLPSHLAYCPGPIRYLRFYVPKIICTIVNRNGIFTVWVKKNLVFFRSLSGSSSNSELPCL